MGSIINIEYVRLFRHLKKWGYSVNEFVRDFESSPETTKTYPIYVEGQHLTYLVLSKEGNELQMRLTTSKSA